MNEVYKIVKKIPRGKTTTYGKIAKQLNISPRLVGRILHLNPDPKNIPCHRVVDRNGNVAANYAFGGARKQKELLIREGVKLKNAWQVELS